MRVLRGLIVCVAGGACGLIGCSRKPATEGTASSALNPAPVDFYKVDGATAGSVTGSVRYSGKKPVAKPIDMSEDPACVEAHGGKAYDESLVVNGKGEVGNAFIYVKSGLEGSILPRLRRL